MTAGCILISLFSILFLYISFYIHIYKIHFKFQIAILFSILYILHITQNVCKETSSASNVAHCELWKSLVMLDGYRIDGSSVSHRLQGFRGKPCHLFHVGFLRHRLLLGPKINWRWYENKRGVLF